MTRKSIKTSAQETVVAAGKSAAEGTKTLAGELAHAAAAATAAATATAAPGVVCSHGDRGKEARFPHEEKGCEKSGF
jgi:hypothetical protein